MILTVTHAGLLHLKPIPAPYNNACLESDLPLCLNLLRVLAFILQRCIRQRFGIRAMSSRAVA